MRNAERKFYTQNPQNWLSAVRFAETCGKKRHVPINGNLFAYAANNPVKYTDPDGKFLINDITSISVKEFLEKKSVFKINFGIGLNFLRNDGGTILSPPNNVVTLPNGLNKAIQDAHKNKNDGLNYTDATFSVSANKMEDGNYEVSLNVTNFKINSSGKIELTTKEGIIAYARSQEVENIFSHKKDPKKIIKIANEVINYIIMQKTDNDNGVTYENK